ncbi:MAG: penicillin-binding protein 2, partial [Nitrospirota bacterium]
MLNRKAKREEKKLWDEDITKIRLKQSKKKAFVLCTIILFCFSVIVIRLVDLMVFDHETLTQKADRQYLGIKTLSPQRGLIWDREMRPLSVNIETESLYAVPSKINDIKRLSYNLAPIIKVSEKRLSNKLLEKKDKDFIWVGRRLDEKTVQKINSLQQKFKFQEELGFLPETKRQYPNGQLASHLLGFTNIDNEGIDGIELRYNKEISGSIKKVYHNRDARGNSLLDNIEESIPGNNLMLTIDEGLQHIVEKEIENAMVAWQAEAVVAIMMEPSTGKILAMANRPTYDPNSVGSVQADERRNRAITDNYEPGSTFKTILASAAIEEKIVSLNEKFDVSKGFIKVPGGIIRDAHRHGVLTFKEVIQKSSNVGASQIALRLGKERFYNYIKKFGFGEKTGIDLPGEAKGLVRKTEKWSGRSLPSIAIGQEISVTPLQLLRAYSAIANGGKLMKPYIVSGIISHEGEIIKSFSPEVEKQVVSETTAKTMRDILKTVVEEGGTAQKASVTGDMVAGKTGTAQMVDPKTGLYSKND